MLQLNSDNARFWHLADMAIGRPDVRF